MTNTSPRSTDAESSEDSTSLTTRVTERVINARLALDAQSKSNRSASRRTGTGADTSSHGSKDAAEAREILSLKRVFRDMGISYRRYRSETGSPLVPGLRDAAHAFRANPSLPALVAVAAFLDPLDLVD